jgi:hypothetical protein
LFQLPSGSEVHKQGEAWEKLQSRVHTQVEHFKHTNGGYGIFMGQMLSFVPYADMAREAWCVGAVWPVKVVRLTLAKTLRGTWLYNGCASARDKVRVRSTTESLGR